MIGLQIVYALVTVISLMAFFCFYEKFIISVKDSTKYTLRALWISARYCKVLFAISIIKDEERPSGINGWELLFKALFESWIYAFLVLCTTVIAGVFAFSLFPQLYEFFAGGIFILPIAIIALYVIASASLSAVFSAFSIKTLSELNTFWKPHLHTVEDFCTNPRFDNIEKPVINFKKLLPVFFLFLVMMLVVFFVESNIWVAVPLVVLCLAFWAVDAIEKKKKNKRRAKQVDTASIAWHLPTDTGTKLEKGIQDICTTYEVNDIEFIIEDVSKRIAHSTLKTDGPSTVTISTGCMRSFSHEGSLDLESILYVMAHEICHIIYKDSRYISIRRGIAALAMALFFISICAMLFSIVFINDQLIKNLTIILSLLMLILFNYANSIICNERYWRAIAELRADSKAMLYSGCSLDVAQQTLQSEDYQDAENEKIKAFDNTNVFYQNFIRMNSTDGHPPIVSRTDFLTTKWGIKSYIRLFFLFKKWHRQGKGWIGY